MNKEIEVRREQELAAFEEMFGSDAEAGLLSEGVSGGFAVLSIRGGKFHVRHGGAEEDLLNADGDPKASEQIVIIDANRHLQKTYYEGAYVAGNTDAPDCFSNDGDFPDKGIESPQHDNCGACPNSQWGSRMTDDGRKAKACQDSRPLAIVPAGDIPNETYDGCMLLRVPAASLKGLGQYGKKLNSRGFSFRKVVTKISFDPKSEYPKLVFTATRPLTDDEKVAVMAVYPSAGNVLEATEPTVAAPAAMKAIMPDPPAEKEELFDDEPKPEGSGLGPIFPGEGNLPQPPKVTKKKGSKKKASKAKPAPAGKEDALDKAMDKMAADFEDFDFAG